MEYEFDRNKWDALLLKTKEILTKPKPEKPVYRRNRLKIQEKIRANCHYHTINSSTSEVNSRRRPHLPNYPSYILSEFRRCLLRHDWGGAKQLLLVIIKSTQNHNVAWTSLTTALAHMPGTLPLLQQFLEDYKDQFFAGDGLKGLLTIGGMQTCKMLLEDDKSAGDAPIVLDEEWTDSEDEDSVYDDSSNLDADDKS